MKKKRLFTSLLAVFMAVAMAFTMVGCQEEESNAVSQKEFMTAVKNSYDNYVSAYKDYDVFGDITATFSLETSYKDEQSYTPDGTDDAVTYYDTYNSKFEGSISIKNIGGELFLTSEYVTTEKEVKHAWGEEKLEEETTVTVTTEKYEFGVEDGTYFVRFTEKSVENGEETDPTKTYQTFADKDAYKSAMSLLLEEFSELYGENPFVIFEIEGEMGMFMMFMPIEYTKENGVYVLSFDLSFLNIDTNNELSELINISNVVKFNNKGAVSTSGVYNIGDGVMNLVMDINYSSSLKAIADFNGDFTEGTVDTSNAIRELSIQD